MKRVTEYVLWIIVFVSISATAFYCGGCIGFSQGYNYAIAKDAPYDANTSVTVLKKIKDNEIESIEDYFEKQLDNAINRHWYHKQNPPVFYGVRFYDQSQLIDENSKKMIISACEYRKENPDQSGGMALDRIETILNYYLKD